MYKEISEKQKNDFIRILEDLQRSCEISNNLRELNNIEIADLLKDHLWSYLDVFSPLADLVEIAIERLKEPYNKSID